ncbi:hypothetical protein F9278_16385 [Streptomyces phaeolivaceus]|uniref:Sporulation delaying protein family toxin n=1 Tax=Streptomyces phaeolivaceus TaxID=2653200 RepID=A0A5P8K3E8_9ACTN|nr:hypothetical protein [Streptomyces phaeolivaceus]QFQ97530.1 hypothetical protein F9278_16385 [Streptomyces phaeolivaceus]
MRKSRGLVVGARAVALAVAVGVAASTGTAGMSWASAQSVRSAQEGERSSGYSAEEIILGFMGEGVVAKEHPKAVLVPKGQAVGANASAVAAFLELASLKEPAFAEEFRAEVTSGDPYRVRKGLERLDTMSRTLAQEAVEGQKDLGTGNGAVVIDDTLSDHMDLPIFDMASVNVVDRIMALDVVKQLDKTRVVVITFQMADVEEGAHNLATEEAVAVITKTLAAK